MISRVHLLVMFSVLQISETKIDPLPPETIRKDQIKLYCNKIDTAFENVTVVYKFFNKGGPVCSDFSSWCLESCTLPKFVGDGALTSPANVVFYNNVNNVQRHIAVRDIGRVENLRAPHHIVFCAEVDDASAKTIAKKIWAMKNLAYFVIVYVTNNLLKVISYDPYAKGGPNINFTNNYENVFARRPKVLKKSLFLMTPTYPVTIQENEKLKGAYIELMEALEICFKTSINPTYGGFLENLDVTYIRSYFQTNPDVLICVKPITYEEANKYSVTDPIDIEDVVVLVPKEKVKNEFNYIFSILTYKIIIWFFVILITMSFLNKILTLGYNSCSYLDVLFDYFGSFLGLPIERFEMKRSIMILSWLIFSLIITVQFKGVFFNEIFNMQQEHKINSLEELKATRMNIYISLEMRSIEQHDNIKYLQDQVHFMTTVFVIDAIKNNSNHAFAVTDTTAKGFLNLHVQHKINFNYRVIDEKLASFFLARVARAALLDDINACILRATDAAVQKSSFVSWPKDSYDDGDRMLTSVHFVGAFILLFIGYLIALVEFLVELIVGRLRATTREDNHVILPYVN